jgi:hypothetical protein
LILNQPIFPGHTSIDAPPPQSWDVLVADSVERIFNISPF